MFSRIFPIWPPKTSALRPPVAWGHLSLCPLWLCKSIYWSMGCFYNICFHLALKYSNVQMKACLNLVDGYPPSGRILDHQNYFLPTPRNIEPFAKKWILLVSLVIWLPNQTKNNPWSWLLSDGRRNIYCDIFQITFYTMCPFCTCPQHLPKHDRTKYCGCHDSLVYL